MNYIGKGMASMAICAIGAYVEWLTGGASGIGWTVLGLFIIWG